VRRPGSEDGFALVVAMMAVLLISAVGTALILTTSIETLITRNFRDGAAASYAAAAAASYAARELSAAADWSPALGGALRLPLFDGTGAGVRTLLDGSAINLTHVTNLANCGVAAGCSDANLAATTLDRPWGVNNPRWAMFGCGQLAAVLNTPSPFYVVILIADDPAETDGDPSIDGSGPGSGVVLLRAEAFGPGGAHAGVELVVAQVVRTVDGVTSVGARIVSWRAPS
jgi:Tfp pilus assembly protein PilX